MWARGEEEEEDPEEDSDVRRQRAERERGKDGEKKGGMPLESAKGNVGDEIGDRTINSEERVLSAVSERGDNVESDMRECLFPAKKTNVVKRERWSDRLVGY